MSSSVIEVPLSKLVASQVNVRRTGVIDGIGELAASIAAHGLLQPLLVAAREDGRYEVVAGGRRLAALKQLAKAKALPRNHQVPVLVREVGEEESLAENMVRAPLHPADQYEAFRRLELGGLGSADIAARFGVSQRVVRQRLALGAISPALMQAYRDGELTLAQLEAFTVTDDHDRQEQAFQALGVYRDPYRIRGMLTQAHVSGRDRRVAFLGLDAYEAGGGAVLRDLFSATEDVWLTDIGLLDRLCLGKLGEIADQVRGEGWLWTTAALDFPHGHGCRRLYPKPVEVAAEIEARRLAANLELEALYRDHPHEDVPEGVAQRMAELDTEITELSKAAYAFEADEIARAGVIVAIGHEGDARIERGFVRMEDEQAHALEDGDASSIAAVADTADTVSGDIPYAGDAQADDRADDDDSGGLALSDRLMADLSAQRTAALRDALARTPDVAMLALAHSLILQGFYGARYDLPSCLTIRIDSPTLGHHAAGIDDGPASRAIAERHAEWAQAMPAEPTELWEWLIALDRDRRDALLAHVVALSVNALVLPHERRTRAIADTDRLAQACALDIRNYWSPTVEHYLGRVTKAGILEAVREGVSPEAAERLSGLRKPDMAREAQSLLSESPWLPACLRTPVRQAPDEEPTVFAEAAE